MHLFKSMLLAIIFQAGAFCHFWSETRAAAEPLESTKKVKILPLELSSGAPKESIVYLPESKIKGVVFWFHGFRGHIEHCSTLMNRLAESGILMVTPQMYDPENIFAIPSPQVEAQEALDFVNWFDAQRANFQIGRRFHLV